MTPTFSAGPQGLGYLFQARFALNHLLSQPDGSRLVIEGLDDIEVDGPNGSISLVQLKHHVSKTAVLSNASADLWKTLRVWSSQYANDLLSAEHTIFTLLTTGVATPGSIAVLLRDDSFRDVDKAHDLLVEVATISESETLAKSFAAFLGLNEPNRRLLVRRIYIVDCGPNIADCTLEIKAKLRPAVKRQFLDALYERVEGWWFNEVVQHLLTPQSHAISSFSLFEKVASLAAGFHDGNLPIDFLEISPGQSTYTSLEGKVFVQQLKAINVDPSRVRTAILDFYRAFEQRSKWARENLLIDNEVEAFERKLVDEWGRFFAACKDELLAEPTAIDLERMGRKVLNWADFESFALKIRPKVEEDYVRRGSFHMLADTVPIPRVFWHPLFLEKLKAIVSV